MLIRGACMDVLHEGNDAGERNLGYLKRLQPYACLTLEDHSHMMQTDTS